MSTLFVLSAVAIALLAITSLVLSHFLLQPVQATSLPTSMQTQNPVNLETSCGSANTTLTFEAKGNGKTLTNGTFQITNSSSSKQILWSGDIFNAANDGPLYELYYRVKGPTLICGIGGSLLEIKTAGCSNHDSGQAVAIELSTQEGSIGDYFPGVINCEFPSDTTAQPSSSSVTGTTGTTTITTQDSEDGDRDGIPDSSDKCAHNSNPRCFKEAT
jgi:hypothetical protein